MQQFQEKEQQAIKLTKRMFKKIDLNIVCSIQYNTIQYNKWILNQN